MGAGRPLGIYVIVDSCHCIAPYGDLLAGCILIHKNVYPDRLGETEIDNNAGVIEGHRDFLIVESYVREIYVKWEGFYIPAGQFVRCCTEEGVRLEFFHSRGRQDKIEVHLSRYLDSIVLHSAEFFLVRITKFLVGGMCRVVYLLRAENCIVWSGHGFGSCRWEMPYVEIGAGGNIVNRGVLLLPT